MDDTMNFELLTREAVLRALVLSSPPACRQVVELARGTDEGIRAVLTGASALCTAIAASTRLKFDDVAALFAALPAAGQPAEITETEIAHVRYMNAEMNNG